MKLNVEIEKIAIEDALKYYKEQGYSLFANKKQGCDLVFTKDGKRWFIEVKGRDRKWAFTNLSRKEAELFKTEPNSILYEVVIDKETKKVKERFIRTYKDVVREEPLGLRMYFRDL